MGTMATTINFLFQIHQVQYWNGSTYQTAATMTHTGDTASTKVTFPNVSTQRIRFYQPTNQGNPGYPSIMWITEADYGTPTLCSTLTGASTLPPSFGTPWDVFNPATLILKATCGPTITADLGTATYIYHQGYTWDGTNWNQTTFTCTGGTKVSQAWCPTSAQGTLPQNSSYYVGYTCNWTGTRWNCGCRDQACTNNYWQLQKIN